MMMNKKSMGILYVNSHHGNLKYIEEANLSAKSFRKYLPDAIYYLYTDKQIPTKCIVDQFDEVKMIDFSFPEFMNERVHLNGQMVAKHKAMQAMNEDIVMYLGADTYALDKAVSSLPFLMDQFDIAVSHAPVRINTEIGNTSVPEVPICFPEMNCDIILYNNTTRVLEFLERWSVSYLEDFLSHPHDQGTFRYHLYFSGLRLYILPPEYNYRNFPYREDTVILQNRFSLPDYLSPKKQGIVRRFFQRIKN